MRLQSLFNLNSIPTASLYTIFIIFSGKTHSRYNSVQNENKEEYKHNQLKYFSSFILYVHAIRYRIL